MYLYASFKELLLCFFVEMASVYPGCMSRWQSLTNPGATNRCVTHKTNIILLLVMRGPHRPTVYRRLIKDRKQTVVTYDWKSLVWDLFFAGVEWLGSKTKYLMSIMDNYAKPLGKIPSKYVRDRVRVMGIQFIEGVNWKQSKPTTLGLFSVKFDELIAGIDNNERLHYLPKPKALLVLVEFCALV